MNAFYKLLHSILFTLSLFFTINSAAKNQCEQSLSSTQSSELKESEGVKGPPPKKPWDRERYIFLFDHTEIRIKSSDEKNLVVERVDLMDGNITEEIIPTSYLSDIDTNYMKITPTKMNFFKSLESRLAAVEPVEYPPFNKEAQMLKKGIKKEMSKGLDEAYKMNYFADYLRKSNINPYTTHIEDFSNQISEHIRSVRKEIKEYKGEASERVKALDKLALEASKKKQEKGVTYAWWLQWNTKLTSLLNERGLNASIVDNSFNNNLIAAFPDFVLLQTFEDLGVMAINKSVSENVFPLGIVNKPVVADGLQFRPFEFFGHDENHAYAIIRTHNKNESRFPYKASKEFYEKIQNLPTDQQTQAEMAYFFITHENAKLYDDASKNFGSSEINLIMKDESLLRLLPEDVRHSEETIRSYLDEAGNVYRDTLNEQ